MQDFIFKLKAYLFYAKSNFDTGHFKEAKKKFH